MEYHQFHYESGLKCCKMRGEQTRSEVLESEEEPQLKKVGREVVPCLLLLSFQQSCNKQWNKLKRCSFQMDISALRSWPQVSG